MDMHKCYVVIHNISGGSWYGALEHVNHPINCIQIIRFLVSYMPRNLTKVSYTFFVLHVM